MACVVWESPGLRVGGRPRDELRMRVVVSDEGHVLCEQLVVDGLGASAWCPVRGESRALLVFRLWALDVARERTGEPLPAEERERVSSTLQQRVGEHDKLDVLGQRCDGLLASIDRAASRLSALEEKGAPSGAWVSTAQARMNGHDQSLGVLERRCSEVESRVVAQGEEARRRIDHLVARVTELEARGASDHVRIDEARQKIGQLTVRVDSLGDSLEGARRHAEGLAALLWANPEVSLDERVKVLEDAALDEVRRRGALEESVRGLQTGAPTAAAPSSPTCTYKDGSGVYCARPRALRVNVDPPYDWCREHLDAS